MKSRQNPRDTFLQVLEIIEYSDDKENFTNSFFQLCQQRATLNLAESLPKGKKAAFNEVQIAGALQKATEETFKSYLETILPSLSNEKRVKLEEFLKKII